MAPFRGVVRWILRNGKRIAVTIVGGVLLLAGLAMLVLPGPGILVIIAGLSVLGTQYAWAQRAMEKAKETGKKAVRKVRGGK